MSENPSSGPMHGPGAGFPPAPTGFQPGPPPWQPAPAKGQSRGLTYAALAIAVIATGLAIVGWFRPTPPPPATKASPSTPTYTEQQIADAKTKACAAVDVVQKAAALHAGTGPQAQLSSDPAMAEAQSANARLAIISGGWYLRDQLEAATPPPLADEIRHVADIMLDLGQNYLAGIRNEDPKQAALIKDGNVSIDRALELCK